MLPKEKSLGHGGAREGAGAKCKDPLLKKQLLTVKIPGWMKDKLKTLPGGQGPSIEKALLAMYDWKAPVIEKK